MNPIIIDVREADEFSAEHIEHSISLPLSSFEKIAPSILNTMKGKPVVMMCRSGKRAALAASSASKLCDGIECTIFEGGILEWKKQGKPTITAKKSHFPIMRQVQLIAGGLVFIGSLLTYFVNPNFLFLTGFVGLGLSVAGATGFCGMAEVLARMPWNKAEAG